MNVILLSLLGAIPISLAVAYIVSLRRRKKEILNAEIAEYRKPPPIEEYEEEVVPKEHDWTLCVRAFSSGNVIYTCNTCTGQYVVRPNSMFDTKEHIALLNMQSPSCNNH